MISQELLQKLTEVGFLAVRLGCYEQAQRIFMSLSVAYPEKRVFLLGLAFCWLTQGQNEKAVAFLAGQCEKHPDDQEFQVLYGIALKKARYARQADKVFDALKEEEQDHSMSQCVHLIAQSALQEL